MKQINSIFGIPVPSTRAHQLRGCLAPANTRCVHWSPKIGDTRSKKMSFWSSFLHLKGQGQNHQPKETTLLIPPRTHFLSGWSKFNLLFTTRKHSHKASPETRESKACTLSTAPADLTSARLRRPAKDTSRGPSFRVASGFPGKGPSLFVG